MVRIIESEKTVKPSHELRIVLPHDITSYFDKHWDNQIQIVTGDPVVVPNGWHGEGKEGDAMVLFGDLLTKPITGTELPSGALTAWLRGLGFYFESNGRVVSHIKASEVLASDAYSLNEKPIVRAVRLGNSGKPPIQIEYYQGSLGPDMKGLTQIGNNSSRSEMDKVAYRGHVANLMRQFIAKGTTKAKEVLGIPRTYKKLRRIDDCLAGMTTVGGDMLIEDLIHPHENVFEEVAVAVATTQAITVAVWLADRRKRPLLIRAGGPSFGLAGPELGMNYMINTQEEMRKLGIYTSGDFGDIMALQGSSQGKPEKIYVGGKNNLFESRFFLNGGGPIYELMVQAYNDRNKVQNGVVSMRRASRIDNGPSMWGVIITGSNM